MASDNISSWNGSACDVFSSQRAAPVLFPVFYSLVFAVSAVGNSLVLTVVCQRRRKLNSTSVYLLHLALSDGLFTLALPGRIAYYARRFDWPFGHFLCRLSTMLFFVNTYAGIGFMTCLSLDRYVAMVQPRRLQRLRSLKVVRRVCCLVWALVSLQVAPLLFREQQQQQQQQVGRRTCMEYSSLEGSSSAPYLLLLACALSFGCPLLLILGCYANINLELRRAAAAAVGGVVGVGGAVVGPNRRRRNHGANTVILLILLTFITCFSPYHLNIMQFMIRKIRRQPTCEELRAFKTSLQITVSLMNLNCCLDPVIYFFAIKSYKQRVMSLFRERVYVSAASTKVTAEISSSNT